MLYLLLATFCSASIALLFKVTESRGNNRIVVSMANYVIASLIAIYFIFKENAYMDFKPSLLIGQSGAVQSNFVILMGLATGVFFLLGFIFYQKSVKESGASLASMFGKLGILLPMVLSIVIWKEYPTKVQWIGILLALMAIILVNSKQNVKVAKVKNISYALILLFIFGGVGDFCNKIFQKYAVISFKPIFLLCVFGTAFILSFSIVKIKKFRVEREALLLGAIVGIPNLFASFFLIEALQYKPATVVFPVYSAGSILIVIVLSRILFKEALRPMDKVAVLMTLCSLFLIQ